jgi:hypothetical protein
MAHECEGTWASSITYFVKNGSPVANPVKEPDGEITVDPHATPAFHGRHDKQGTSTPLDRTDCRPGTFGNVHIVFSRRLSGGGHIAYEGHVLQGKFIFGYVEHRGGPADGDTGTWGATKEAGPTNRDKDKDKKGKGDSTS